jgi:hypothetical protein
MRRIFPEGLLDAIVVYCLNSLRLLQVLTAVELWSVAVWVLSLHRNRRTQSTLILPRFVLNLMDHCCNVGHSLENMCVLILFLEFEQSWGVIYGNTFVSAV